MLSRNQASKSGMIRPHPLGPPLRDYEEGEVRATSIARTISVIALKGRRRPSFDRLRMQLGRLSIILIGCDETPG